MAQTMVNFRMDADLKREMENTYKDMGLTATAAYTLFAKKPANKSQVLFSRFLFFL